jgi:hypothetical protein
VKQLRAAFPDSALEVWAFDEHPLGLKPIVRKVWSKRGQRPIAVVHHRYEWLYLDAFVCPRSGQSTWLLLPSMNVAWFNYALQEFAKAVGAGASKPILLVVDGAGWHRSAKVEIRGHPFRISAPLFSRIAALRTFMAIER